MSDRDPSIWPRVDLTPDLTSPVEVRHLRTSEPDDAVQWQGGLIKQLTDCEPMEVRERYFFGAHHAGVDEPGNITWFGFDGTRFIPLDLPVGDDGAAVMPEPTSGLAADGDPIPKSASRYRVEDDVQWLAAGDRLDDQVQPIPVMSENEGSNIDGIDESRGGEPSGLHLDHVPAPERKIGLGVGWLWLGHVLSFLGFGRAPFARPAEDTPISDKKDAA